jgi:hypothetical protein
MTKLPDLGAYYVDISSSEKHHHTCIILDEQGNEIQHQLSDYAQNTTEEIQEFMDLVEKHLKRSMD